MVTIVNRIVIAAVLMSSTCIGAAENPPPVPPEETKTDEAQGLRQAVFFNEVKNAQVLSADGGVLSILLDNSVATADSALKRDAGVTALAFTIPIAGHAEKGTVRIATKGNASTTNSQCVFTADVNGFATTQVYDGETVVLSEIAMDTKPPFNIPVVMTGYCMLKKADALANGMLSLDSIEITWSASNAGAKPQSRSKAQKQVKKK